jgi:ubiquinol-cytochrome c reductase cytochrome b subunit
MALGDWLDARLGHRAAIKEWLEHPILGGPSWLLAVGGGIVGCFAILALTGILLATAYAPATQSAWASVHYVGYVLPGGWVIRGVHYAASDALIVLVGVHVAHIVVVGAYQKPRDLWFWLALVLFGLTLGAAITGHLLPWDQKGWWARKVEVGIVAMAPGVGAWIQTALFHGSDLASLALTRAYAAHVVLLPALFVVVFMLRARVVRRAATGAPVTSPYSAQLVRDLAIAIAVLAVVSLLAVRAHGAPLDAPADPLSDYPARPEWFLLALYRLRKYFHGTGEFWGPVGLPAALGLYVALLPRLDARPGRPLSARLGLLAPVAVCALGLGVLQVSALRKDSSDADYQKQVVTADAEAALAVRAAMDGVPATGPLDMPELRGRAVFAKACAGCHVLGDLGDAKKTKAPALDGWGTTAWLTAMLHDPDAADKFAHTPYKGMMPSADAPAKTDVKEKPMLADPSELAAVAEFLASEGDLPNEVARDAAKVKAGEKIVAERCTTCHLYKGDGDVEGSGTAPELSGYGSVAWTKAQVADPTSKSTYREAAVDAPGDKGHMPRFSDQLSAADVELVALWTRAHGRGGALH